MSPFPPNSNTTGPLAVDANYAVRVVPPLDLIEFNKDCLRAHNDYRRAHSAPSLKLDEKLRRYAQEWADVIRRIVCCHSAR